MLKLFLLFPVIAMAAEPAPPIKAVVARVIDGDTVSIVAHWVPDPMKKEIAVRVYGVDTPEKSFRAQCAKEAELGAKATEFTKAQIAKAKKIEVAYFSWD